MAKPGTKPKPTRLRLLQGNPGKQPINRDEPKPATVQRVRVPRHLSKDAKAEYRRVAKMLIPLGMLTEADHRALELYADTYSTWKEATDKVTASGLLIKTPSGYPAQNPYLSIANQASKRMQSLLSEFGMTPSSRSRVSAAVPKSNEFDDL